MPKVDFKCSCGATKDDELVLRDSNNEGKYLDWDTKEPIKCDECGSEMEALPNLTDFPYMHSGKIHKSASANGGTVKMKRLSRKKGPEPGVDIPN